MGIVRIVPWMKNSRTQVNTGMAHRNIYGTLEEGNEAHLVQGKRIVLKRGIGKNDIDDKNDAHQYHVLPLRLLQRAIVEKRGATNLIRVE